MDSAYQRVAITERFSCLLNSLLGNIQVSKCISQKRVVNGTQFGNVRPCDLVLERTRNSIHFRIFWVVKKVCTFFEKVFELVYISYLR